MNKIHRPCFVRASPLSIVAQLGFHASSRCVLRNCRPNSR
jgi:hypothetical protein